jgi:hypothetical protein
MKESYQEDLANHFGLELYADGGNVMGVATTDRSTNLERAIKILGWAWSVCRGALTFHPAATVVARLTRLENGMASFYRSTHSGSYLQVETL